MSRRRYFEEQRSGNGAIYHCVETEIEPGDRIRLFNLMNKIKSDTISQDKINSVLNQLREGPAFNIHTHSSVSFSFSSTSTGYEPMAIWIRFDPYPASEQQGIIYKFQINDQRYVFMFSNRYDGMRDLINNADEDVDLKSATKLFSVLLASKRPLITELADKLRLKYPLLPTISPCPTMRLEAIRSIIPISCRRYPKSV